jgi:hypothetical protein
MVLRLAFVGWRAFSGRWAVPGTGQWICDRPRLITASRLAATSAALALVLVHCADLLDRTFSRAVNAGACTRSILKWALKWGGRGSNPRPTDYQ